MEFGEAVVFDLFGEAPAEAGDDADLGGLHRPPEFTKPVDVSIFANKPRSKPANTGINVPVIRSLQVNALACRHDLDVVQVARLARHDLAEGVDLALFEDPALRTGHHAARRPAGEVAALQDEARRAQRTHGRCGALDDVAREDVRGVWVWVAQEEGKRDDGPWVTGERKACAVSA